MSGLNTFSVFPLYVIHDTQALVDIKHIKDSHIFKDILAKEIDDLLNSGKSYFDMLVILDITPDTSISLFFAKLKQHNKRQKEIEEYNKQINKNNK